MDTEKSKMLKGLLYQAFDEELVRDRYRAHDLVYEYNRLKPSDISERERVLVALLGEVGDTFYIEPPFFLRLRIPYPAWRELLCQYRLYHPG